MSKSIRSSKAPKKLSVPLIKRPIEEIIAIAREAGRNALTTPEVARSACETVRYEWIGQTFDSGDGLSDDEFNAIVNRSAEAFDEGFAEAIACLKEPSTVTHRTLENMTDDYRAGVTDAIAKLGEWVDSEQLANEIGAALCAALVDPNADRRTGFAETIGAYLLVSMDYGSPIPARWSVYDDLTMQPGTRHD